MNISELARRLKITTSQLYEALPALGFDVGRRAIKIDNAVALKITKLWPAYQTELLKQKKADESDGDGQETPAEKRHVAIPPIITVRDFAVVLNVPVTRLIHALMNNGILAALNEKIDYETAAIIAEDFGAIPEPEKNLEAMKLELTALTDPIKDVIEKETPDTLQQRPPVIVVMGHVDHGKTTLLDTLRTASVASAEAGGITQHIGAYQLMKLFKKTGEERLLTFIDTPGHEAFTTMRSRGAKIADIAILVVAADDGVKPQTAEAVKIIQAAGIPLVVAINKMDKQNADVDRVKRELSDIGLIPEDWGGKTVCIPISAKNNVGLDDLLEVLLLVADMESEKLLANPKGVMIGTVIESHIDKNEGPIATLLVQNGTLNTQDYLIVSTNTLAGRVRAMRDHVGHGVQHAPPSQPVRIIGLKIAPAVGECIRGIKTLPREIEKDVRRTAGAHSIVVTSHTKKKEGQKAIHVILKTDTLGSLEAIATALSKIDHRDVHVKIVARDLGAISSADVLNAEATDSFIAGFHVGISSSAAQLAQEKNVEIKLYKIIYELLDDVRARTEALLAPEIKKTFLGTARILKIFKQEQRTAIIGARVEEGALETGTACEIVRGKNQEIICEGTLAKLRSGKQDIERALAGQECGISFEGRCEMREHDIIRSYQIERLKRTLDEV